MFNHALEVNNVKVFWDINKQANLNILEANNLF